MKRDLPFCAGPIIEVLSHMFLGPKAISALDETIYKSSYTAGKEATQLEIPMVMCAFVATVVRCPNIMHIVQSSRAVRLVPLCAKG